MADFTCVSINDSRPYYKTTDVISGSLLTVHNRKQQEKCKRVLMIAKPLALLVLCLAAAVCCINSTWQVHALNSRLSRLEDGAILQQDGEEDAVLSHNVVVAPPPSSIGSRDHVMRTDVDDVVSTLRPPRLRRHAQFAQHKKPHKRTANVTHDHLRKNRKLSDYRRFKDRVNKKFSDINQYVQTINYTMSDISKNVNKIFEELQRYNHTIFDLTTIGRGIRMTHGDQDLLNNHLSNKKLLQAWEANSVKEKHLFKLNSVLGTVTIPYTGRYLVYAHITLSSDKAQPNDHFNKVEYAMMRNSQALMRCSTPVPNTDNRNDFVCFMTSTMKLMANDVIYITYDGPRPIDTLVKLNVDVDPNQTSWGFTYLGSD